MTLNDLLLELYKVEHLFWFVKQIEEIDLTDDAVKARLRIEVGLFVQVFFSERSGRLSFTLVQGNQRIYGRDREYGQWHRHPFGDAEHHEPTPGVSMNIQVTSTASIRESKP